MSLLEVIRKTGKPKAGEEARVNAYIVKEPMRLENEERQKKKEAKLKRKDIDLEELQEFARDYKCKGEKLIAFDTVWRMNDRYYGQWLALNVPFKKWEDLRDEEIEEKVPKRYHHLAVALKRKPEYWREEGLQALRENMKLEAINNTQVDTVLAMITARTHVIDKYMKGHLNRDEEAQEADNRPAGAACNGDEDLKHDPIQELFDARARECLDKALSIQSTESDDEDMDVDELRKKVQERAKAFAVRGPPGSGKTRRAKALIRYTLEKGGKVLCTYPTGEMQSRLRAELRDEGLDVDCDTCHGAFQLHKRENDAIPILEDYTLIIVDEFPQLSAVNFERIIRAWQNAGKVPVLIFLGDFHQLPSIEGTTAKDSPYWKHVFKVQLNTCWRVQVMTSS
jgi:hypothetical protein